MGFEQNKKSGGYRKIRYYLIIENVFIVLAFLLFAVGVYHYIVFGFRSWAPYAYMLLGLVMFCVGVTIAFKMTKAFTRDDLPVYSNIMASEEIDPETGLLYYDEFIKKAEIQLDMALTDSYLCSFQIEGAEHLRHFVGYQKAADTMSDIGDIFKDFQHKMGEQYCTVGCKSGHEIMMLVHEVDYKDIQSYLSQITASINDILLRLATAENFTCFCAYSAYPQHASSLSELVKNTNFAIYEAVTFRKTEPHMFSPDSFNRQEKEYLKDNKLRQLLDNNLLQYNFQPIVSAKTGKIYAYEALMRTNKEMGFTPTDVLELAERQDRLYDVEHYTFYNVIRIMAQNASFFDKRKLFINSIPTVIIKENEFDELLAAYGSVMGALVIEITENGMQSEESCETVHNYMKKSGCELALDDYGTGYSNASTLLNNSPQYLKIDHSMIMGIDTDSKKQHLVSSYVSFANNHNMKILAEGVETPEELQMVIQLGCHLIQGFYTCKPQNTIIESIDEKIEDEILAINLKLAKLSVESKEYNTVNYDNVSVVNLALDFYSQINVKETTTRIVGDKDREVAMNIKIADGLTGVLALRDVNIRGKDSPAVVLGENCNLVLCIEGENTLSYEGIVVPESSHLTIQGSGNLSIHVDHNNGVGIGTAEENVPYGRIKFDQNGTVSVENNGDVVVGIGGITSNENSELVFEHGNIEIICNGSKSVGIGSISGYTKILLNRSNIAVSSSGADCVGIGTFLGEIAIKSIADIELDVSGSNSIGIGCLKECGGEIELNEGRVRVMLHCMNGTAIGSFNGHINTTIFGEEIFVYAEGSDVCGIGNFRGDGITTVRTGAIKISLLAANPVSLGGLKGKLEITGGNIFADLSNSPQPVNGFDTPVYPKCFDSQVVYCKKISTEEGSYQYRAKPTELFDHVYIYVPKYYNEIDIPL